MSKAHDLLNDIENIMLADSLIREVTEQKKWSQAITAKAKWHPPEGLFSTGTATEIARVLLQTGDPLRTLIQRLVFYINRAGRNLKAGRREAIKEAMNIIRKAKGSIEEA